MRHLNYLLVALLVLGITSCKREDPSLGEPPSAADAQFTYTPTAANANIIDLRAAGTDYQARWDFGNGTTAEGTAVQAVYPNAGVYTVTLTVFAKGGSATSSQDITIAQTDPTLLNNPIFNMLAGGATGPGSKTWVIDSANAGHFGVGPDPVSALGNVPEYYSASPGDKAGVGMYDDRYTFYLNNFQFDMVTNGESYVHNGLSADFPGSFENGGDYTAPWTDQLNESWNLIEGADTSFTVSGDAWLGMFTGLRRYRILSITDTSLSLQYEHYDGTLLWYLNLIPEGFVPTGGGGGGGGGSTYSLPLDFESGPVTFTTFGNSSYQVIANPDPSGINTSGNVLETVHGNETWAGLFVDLDNTLDFSTNTNIVLKVWAPATGVFRCKVENSSDTNDFVELDVNVTTANAWEEITVDFSGSNSGVYDRLVLFPGWNVANAGTFYLDDISQQ